MKIYIDKASKQWMDSYKYGFTEIEISQEDMDKLRNRQVKINWTQTTTKKVSFDKVVQKNDYGCLKFAQALLHETDWKVLRHLEQKEMGVTTSMTDTEFNTLMDTRKKIRDNSDKGDAKKMAELRDKIMKK